MGDIMFYYHDQLSLHLPFFNKEETFFVIKSQMFIYYMCPCDFKSLYFDQSIHQRMKRLYWKF